MTPLATLIAAGLRARLAGEAIMLGPPSLLTPALRELVRANRADIIAALEREQRDVEAWRQAILAEPTLAEILAPAIADIAAHNANAIATAARKALQSHGPQGKRPRCKDTTGKQEKFADEHKPD